MIRFCNNNKGAISVFLVIILLPMMVFSWLLIDSARIKLAYSRTAAATEMTMNAALSNYDGILKDMYGLFAISQTKDELMNNLDEYFMKNLMIAGLDEEDAGYINENVIHKALELGATSGTDAPYADLLSPQIDSFTVGLYHSSSLANPRMLKDQVINFMKYRAPLGIGLELLESLKNFETVDKQTNVVENKTKYYESQASLESHLRNAWAAIERYQDLYKGASDVALLSDAHIKEMEDFFTGDTGTFYKNVYTNVSYALRYELLLAEPSTSGVPDYYSFGKYARKIYLSPDKWNYKYLHGLNFSLDKKGEVYTYRSGNLTATIDFSKVIPTEESENVSMPNQIKWYIYGNTNSNTLRGTESTYTKYEDGFLVYSQEQGSDLSSFFLQGRDISAELDYNRNYAESNCLISYINRIIENLGVDAGQDLYDNFFYPLQEISKTAVEGSAENTEEDENEEQSENNEENNEENKGNQKDNEKNGNKQEEQIKIYLTQAQIDKYKNFMRFLIQLSTFDEKRQKDYATKDYEYYAKPELEKVYKFWRALNSAKSNLETAQSELNSAIELFKGDLKTNRDNWKGSATELANTSFGKSNVEEAKQVEDKFDEQEMRKLYNILGKKLTTVNTMLTQLEEITFCDVPIYKLSSIYSFYELYAPISNYDNYTNKKYKKVDIDADNGLIVSILNQFKNAFEGTGNGHKGHLNYTYSDNDSMIPFHAAGKMYSYMSKVYKGASKTVDASNDTQQSSKDDVKRTNDELSSGKNNKTQEVKKPSNAYKTPSAKGVYTLEGGFPSKIDLQKMDADEEQKKNNTKDPQFNTFGDNVGKNQGDDWSSATNSVHGAGDGATSFFGKILQALSDGLESLRDVLYIEEYIMGMFSYQTIEKEVFTDMYKTQIGDNVFTKIATYSNFSLYQGDGKLRENGFGSGSIEIDRDAILEKIETLTNISIKPEFNVQYLNEVEYMIYGESGSDGVEATIFAIRFILNLIAAFMNSELTSLARSIATAIFGTPPLTFLVPIAIVAIIIACAIGESTIDKQLIMGGFSVPVFKSKENWILSPSGVAREGTQAAIGVGKELVKTGIEKAYTELNNCIDDLSKKADQGITSMGDGAIDTLGTALEGAYDDTLGSYVDAVTEELVTLVDSEIQIAYLQVDGDKISIDNIVEGVKSKLAEQVGLSVLDKNGLEYKIKNAAIDYIVNNTSTYVEPLVKAIDVTNGYAGSYTLLQGDKVNTDEKNPLYDIPKTVREKVLASIKDPADNVIGSVADEIREIKNEAVADVKKAAKNGKDELKKASDKFLDGLSEKIPGGGDDSVLSSEKGKTFSLGYSGYLRIFLLIALLTNTDDVLKRMGDVIQLNVQKQNSKFKLSNSYCFVELSIDSRINPLFFSFDGLNRFLGYQDGEGLAIENMYKSSYFQRSGY